MRVPKWYISDQGAKVKKSNKKKNGPRSFFLFFFALFFFFFFWCASLVTPPHFPDYLLSARSHPSYLLSASQIFASYLLSARQFFAICYKIVSKMTKIGKNRPKFSIFFANILHTYFSTFFC